MLDWMRNDAGGVIVIYWPWNSLAAMGADVRWGVVEPGLLSFDLP